MRIEDKFAVTQAVGACEPSKSDCARTATLTNARSRASRSKVRVRCRRPDASHVPSVRQASREPPRAHRAAAVRARQRRCTFCHSVRGGWKREIGPMCVSFVRSAESNAGGVFRGALVCACDGVGGCACVGGVPRAAQGISGFTSHTRTPTRVCMWEHFWPNPQTATRSHRSCSFFESLIGNT